MKSTQIGNTRASATKLWIGVFRPVLSIGITISLASPPGLLGQEQDTVRPPSIKVQAVSGQPATNNIKSRKGAEPVVLVTDERGQPVSGVMVVFTLPETGPGGAFADGSKRAIVYTDAEGRAVARGLRPNQTAGQFEISVDASFHGLTDRKTIRQSNVLPAAGSSSRLIAILAIAGGAAVAGAVAASKGGGSTPSSPTSPPGGAAISIDAGTPTFRPPQ